MTSVICVDDDEDIQVLYKNILGKRKYDVRIYGEGREAVNAFTEKSADVVLLDIEMPGLSGLETCKELRNAPRGTKIPIIVVSSKDSEELIVTALSNGVDDYIVKPFKASELLAKITYAIRRRQAGIKTFISLSFSEKYQIINKIDDGGQTAVYLAKDLSCDPHREVALKIFKQSFSGFNQEHAKTLFLREAYEWSKLKHPNIVKLYDFGQTAGSYYLVLEYIHGLTLWDSVNENGPQEEQHLIYIANELIKALAHMAKFNLVHRDMKPNNILLSYDGDVKLTDFGLAKQKQDDKMTVIDDVFKGTPDFVSPEQIEGNSTIGIASDIYSLGATLFYAATARYPFRGETIIETLNNHFNINPKPIHELNKKYSKEFSEIVRWMIAKEPEDRISINELKSVLRVLVKSAARKQGTSKLPLNSKKKKTSKH